jgi:hypothetical protein
LREQQPVVQVNSGDRLRLLVEIACKRDQDDVSVVVPILDDGLDNVFYTSTAVMGMKPLNLRAGQRARLEFDVSMNLASGTFHLAAFLHHADTDREIDELRPAATFFVSAVPEVRGTANIFPTIVNCSVIL